MPVHICHGIMAYLGVSFGSAVVLGVDIVVGSGVSVLFGARGGSGSGDIGCTSLGVFFDFLGFVAVGFTEAASSGSGAGSLGTEAVCFWASPSSGSVEGDDCSAHDGQEHTQYDTRRQRDRQTNRQTDRETDRQGRWGVTARTPERAPALCGCDFWGATAILCHRN